MTIQDDDLIPGAAIHVRGTLLARSDENAVHIRLGRASNSFQGIVPIADIVHVDPRPVATGDRIRHVDDRKGIVLAIHEDEAWIRLDDSSYNVTVKLSNLRRE
jgi:hypothetical protein